MTDGSENDTNLAKLRELTIRGKEYREDFDLEYYGTTNTVDVRPLVDIEFLPIAAFLEDALSIDAEEAQELVEEEREENDGNIDPSNFDEEFVQIMQRAAILGMTDGPRPDEDEEPDAAAQWDEMKEQITEEVESLQGGKSLEMAEVVLDISSDAASAKSFRTGRNSQ